MPDDQYFYVASTPEQWDKLKPRAREMRHTPTAMEQRLWTRLRNRRVKGAKFRRQHAILGFIVDFVCVEQLLVVEVDGDIHDTVDQKAYDQDRQAVLESMGYHVIRFRNEDVQDKLETVIERIAAALEIPSPNAAPHLDVFSA